MVFMQRQRIKDLLLRARVVVRTSNMKISGRRLAVYVKKLHQKACRTTIFPLSTNQIIDLWRCRHRCHRHFLNFLIFGSTRNLSSREERSRDVTRGYVCFDTNLRYTGHATPKKISVTLVMTVTEYCSHVFAQQASKSKQNFCYFFYAKQAKR